MTPTARAHTSGVRALANQLVDDKLVDVSSSWR